MGDTRDLRFAAGEYGEVSALLLQPVDADWLFVLAHGAGAGMRHAFMQSVAEQLSECRIATFRYQFPYTERGQSRPDSPRVLVATIRAAVAAASRAVAGLPVIAGGKSMGGRLTSVAQSEAPLPGVKGLVFLGYPLHPPGRPSDDRGAHLSGIQVPMLFLQGTRDQLADLSLLRPVCESLGKRAALHVVENADHSFHVPKRAGRSDAEVVTELARTLSEWARKIG